MEKERMKIKKKKKERNYKFHEGAFIDDLHVQETFIVNHLIKIITSYLYNVNYVCFIYYSLSKERSDLEKIGEKVNVTLCRRVIHLILIFFFFLYIYIFFLCFYVSLCGGSWWFPRSIPFKPLFFFFFFLFLLLLVYSFFLAI